MTEEGFDGFSMLIFGQVIKF